MPKTQMWKSEAQSDFPTSNFVFALEGPLVVKVLKPGITSRWQYSKDILTWSAQLLKSNKLLPSPSPVAWKSMSILGVLLDYLKILYLLILLPFYLIFTFIYSYLLFLQVNPSYYYFIYLSSFSYNILASLTYISIQIVHT